MKVHNVKVLINPFKNSISRDLIFNSKVDLHLKLGEACNEFLKPLNIHFKIKSLSDPNLFSGYHPDK